MITTRKVHVLTSPTSMAILAARALGRENGRRLLAKPKEEFMTEEELALLIDQEFAPVVKAVEEIARIDDEAITFDVGADLTRKRLILLAQDSLERVAQATTPLPVPDMLREHREFKEALARIAAYDVPDAREMIHIAKHALGET